MHGLNRDLRESGELVSAEGLSFPDQARLVRAGMDGAPVTEATVALLGYTHEYFFVAFVCKDKRPDLIRGHMLARDSLGDDDSVQVMLDTFNDQHTPPPLLDQPVQISMSSSDILILPN